MKSYISHGKFRPPKWFKLVDAKKRQARLPGECERIERDLADPDRRLLHASDETKYQAWRLAAVSALAMFRKESPLLDEWITEHRHLDAELLLREARKLLLTFEEDGVEFEPEEAAVMVRIDVFFEHDDAKKGNDGIVDSSRGA